jgi:hypothetical protein
VGGKPTRGVVWETPHSPGKLMTRFCPCPSHRFTLHSPRRPNKVATFCRVAPDQSAVSLKAFATEAWRKKMKKHARFLSGALTLILVSSSTSYAWNGRGHMIVAAVAYQKLTQQTKNRVDALLLLNPDRDNWLDLIPAGTSAARRKMMIFMIAATWADRIKGDPDYHTDGTHNGNRPPNDPSASQNIGYDDLARHKYWHFVDLPFTQDNTPLPALPTPNAQTQIAAFRAVLASNSSDALKSDDGHDSHKIRQNSNGLLAEITRGGRAGLGIY